MIVGLGMDVVEIARMDAALSRFEEKLAARLFTQGERAYAECQARRAAAYAKRFAAKEACAKALGCGIGAGASWQEIEVTREANGKPALRLWGRAAITLSERIPENCVSRLHVSLSDTDSTAHAIVIIEAVPLAEASALDIDGLP